MRRRYRFILCDVFTTSRFGGNPLAVIPDADGLTTDEMQSIAREFNFSESTFVLPPTGAQDRRVRIFTPTQEVPFAGHPNVGTACMLAADGAFGETAAESEITFEETAGDVAVSLRRNAQGAFRAEIEAPQDLSLGAAVDPARVAAALSLATGDVATGVHAPVVASVGLPFLVAEVASREALTRARVDTPALAALRDDGIVPDIHAWCRSRDEFDIRARMFAPFDGVPEDPATGSANGALAALLTRVAAEFRDGLVLTIGQGIEMGRPSRLELRTRRDGERIRTWIGGDCVPTADGTFYLD